VITDQVAKQFEVTAGTPGMLLRRRTFDASSRCFEVARDVYRGDRAEFHIDAPIPRGATGSEPTHLVTLRDAS
jgi:DNA-binding GntR family transcriptional regulator